MLHVITWWLIVQLFAAAALPLAFRLFRHLPDRGSESSVAGLADTHGHIVADEVAEYEAGTVHGEAKERHHERVQRVEDPNSRSRREDRLERRRALDPEDFRSAGDRPAIAL